MIASFYGEDERTRIKVVKDNLFECISSLTGNYFQKEVRIIVTVVVVVVVVIVVVIDMYCNCFCCY